MYKFRIKDCLIPLAYYFAVIIVASVASAAVTGWSASLGLEGDDLIIPNYAFTQINPLPFEVPPVLVLELWGYEINVLYVLGLYAFYVAIFFTFYGLYRLFLFVHGTIVRSLGERRALAEAAADGLLDPAEEAFTSDEDDLNIADGN